MLTPLLAKISEYFPDHDKTCLKNVLTLSLCMIIKETVNLNKLKGTVGIVLGRSSTQSNSNYKRLIRIFDLHSDGTLWLDLLTFVFTFLGLTGDYLILDGTSWRSGKRKFHFLTLCVVYQGTAIPIFCRAAGAGKFTENRPQQYSGAYPADQGGFASIRFGVQRANC